MKKTAKRAEKTPLCIMRTIALTILAMTLIVWVNVADASGKKEEINTSGGILEQEIETHRNLMIITLLGVTHYEVTELFNDILSRTPGVVEAKRYRVHVEPGDPRACIVVWHVRVKDTDSFQLEHDLYSTIRAIAKGDKEPKFANLSSKSTAGALKIFKNIRPYQASIKKIEFVHDLPLTSAARDKHKTYMKQFLWRYGPNRGFE
jgi:hypothetical protein